MHAFKAGALLLLAFPAASFATITGVSGQVFQLSTAPVAFTQGLPVPAAPPQLATAWDELQNVTVSGLAVDMINNPGSSSSGPTPGSLTGTVDSHYLYFRHLGSPVTGTVTFSGKIIGLAFSGSTLLGSDPILMPSTTTYTPAASFRGLTLGLDVVSTNFNVLTFNLFGSTLMADTAEVRIITDHVPAPGSAALLGLAGLATARRRRARPARTIAACPTR